MDDRFLCKWPELPWLAGQVEIRDHALLAGLGVQQGPGHWLAAENPLLQQACGTQVAT
jgi:hypothetical protein